MTPEELIVRMIRWRDAIYSVKDQPVEEQEMAMAVLALSAKLATAEAQCVHLREARQVDMDMLDRMDREHVALSMKLQEAEKRVEEADEARLNAQAEAYAEIADLDIVVLNRKPQEVQAERDRAKELDVTLRTMLFAAQDELGAPALCACGHHRSAHMLSLVHQEQKGRLDCNHCACESFRPVEASRGEAVKPAAQTTEQFRAEVKDKLGVVFNGCHSTPLQRAINRQQCEDFLVERYAEACLERGEVVKACPHCGAHIYHLFKRSEYEAWVCGYCKKEFTEPDLWQHVTPSCR